MEIGNELSDKIRSAIKAKLVDLGAYVDDELPDYIMVMVANKKTQDQMTEDLNLFLGSNTEKFTAWLSALLAKLKAVTSIGDEEKKEGDAPQETPKPATEKNGKPPTATTSKPAPTEAVEELEPELTIKPEQDEFEEEERLEKKKALLASQATQSKQAAKPTPKKVTAPKTSSEKEKISPKSSSIRARLGEKISPKSSSSSSESSSVRKRKTPGSVVGSIVKRDIDLEEEEYDPHKPMIGKVASTIRVGNRRSSVPITQQASKSLVLKAVSEAHHSIERSSSKMVSDQMSRPVHRRLGALPRDSRSGVSRNGSSRSQRSLDRSVELFTRRTEKSSSGSSSRQTESHSYEHDIGDIRKIEIKVSESPNREEESPEVEDEDAQEEEEEVPSSIRHIQMKPDSQEKRIPETLIQSGAEESDFTDEDESPPPQASESPRLVQQANPVVPARPSSPKFVVTLDGVDQVLVNKAMTQAEEEEEEEEMEAEMALKRHSDQEISFRLGNDEDELGPFKKSKMMERCRFWPACKMGNDCDYHHPTVPCTMFPRCKFGDKCLYIHPNCKFDANCTRPKCPFTHASQRGSTYPVVIQPVKILPVAKPSAFIAASNRISASQPTDTSEIKCRFFPKCTNMNCPYNHPKPCRYGIGCGNKATCPFSHPALPSKNQLKWIPPKHSNVTIKLDEQAE